MVAEDEAALLESWQLERLLELGFEQHHAFELAGLSVSWHDAERLVRLGCPPATAFTLLSE